MTAPLIWFLIGVALFAAEIMTPALVLLFFGIGAWAAALTALMDVPAGGQAAVFIAASLLSLVFFRQKARGIFSGRSGDPAPSGGHPLAGRRGIVSKALTPGSVGEIDIDGSFWRAMSDTPMSQGQAVLVQGPLAGDALILRVTAESTP